MELLVDGLQSAAGLTRRDVLKGLAALALFPGAALALAGCTTEVIEDLLDAILNRPTRRNVGGLDPDDDIILTYVDAIGQMKALPQSDKRNWTRQAQIHNDRCPHSNWLFLPWHRHFLFWFESIVRDLTGESEWALPYWNWIEDPQVPDMFQSGVLSHPRDSNSTSVPAATADYAMGFSSFINFGSGALSPGESQRPMIRKTKSPFENQVHDTVHVDLGNFTNGMGSFVSPLDPIFWLHHNMIEYMWVEWNVGRGNLNPAEGHWGGYEFNGDFADPSGVDVTGFQSSVQFSLLFPLIAYQFENSSVGTVLGSV